MSAVEHREIEAGVLLVTLNRPERLNAIDGVMLSEMEAVVEMASDPGRYRAVVLTGTGRGFCAGADLSPSIEPWEPTSRSERSAFKRQYDAQERFTEMYTALYECPVPWIAAVNGVAVGGGLAFSLNCDIRIAADTARFGSVFIKAGLSSMDMGTSYLLPRIVGAGHARELMLTGRIIESDEAYRIGLVHEVVPLDGLIEAALVKAREIAANNPLGVWQTKIGLNAALDAPSLRHAKEIENRTQMLAGFTNNPQEASAALMEKRTAVWDPL